MTQIVSYRTVPISVSDEKETYYLFDLLLPMTFCEKTMINIIQSISNIRSRFSGKNLIDRELVMFFESIPYTQFNYISIPVANEELRTSILPLTTILIGTNSFPLSPLERDDISVCLALVKSYL